MYELRSYESPTEELHRIKVNMFNAGGEVTLFKRLDFQAVFYSDVLSGSRMPNLIYMVVFTDCCMPAKNIGRPSDQVRNGKRFQWIRSTETIFP